MITLNNVFKQVERTDSSFWFSNATCTMGCWEPVDYEKDKVKRSTNGCTNPSFSSDTPCSSCGKIHVTSPLDHLGRCPNTVKKFWDNVRKLYWHRREKNPALKLE